jgi:DNA polymerase-3 subunit alpha
LDKYRGVFENPKVTRIADLAEVSLENGRANVSCAGFIQRMEIKYTKKDNKAFATFALEDFSGSTEVIAWNDQYEKFKDLIKDGAVIGLRARCQKDDRTENMRLTIQEIKPLKPKAAKQPLEEQTKKGQINGLYPKIVLRLDCRKHQPVELDTIREILYHHPGETAVHFQIKLPSDKSVLLAASDAWGVDDSDELRAALQPWLA